VIYLPSRRWYAVAAVLAPIALAGLIWSQAGFVLLVLDLLWLLAAVIDGWRLSALDPDSIGIVREAPPAFSVGRALPVTYRWTNPLPRKLALVVREVFPPELRPEHGIERALELEPGRIFRDEVRLTPTRRGKGLGGRLHLRILGPWGLVWRQVRREMPWQATVYPNLVGASLRSLPTQAQRRREAGFRNVRRLGEGRLFESLKEWVPGEDTRNIDWKATARRGKVMARQY
jgi:uncharacterized protein (DUF58 family)